MTKTTEDHTKYPPTNDLVFKKLFGEDKEDTKKALVFLINEIVGFKGTERIEKIRIMNPYTVSDLKKKRSILDVKAIAENGVKYNVEMQVNKQSHYSARALYYWGKLYTEDLPERDNYDKLAKTIGIHILDFDIYEGFHLYKKHIMSYTDNATGKSHKSFKNIEMHTIELPKLEKQFSNYDNIIKVIAAFLKDPEFIMKNRDKFNRKKIEELERLSNNYNKLYFTKEEKEGLEERLKAERDERSIRKTLVMDALAKGIERGEANKAKKMAIKMLNKNKSIEEIATFTDLTIEEINKLRK